jgi:hypothetical protein
MIIGCGPIYLPRLPVGRLTGMGGAGEQPIPESLRDIGIYMYLAT